MKNLCLIRILFFLLACAAFRLASAQSSDGLLRVDTNIEGGNAQILNIDQESSTITFVPELRDTKGWWFYWRFDVLNAGGKVLKLKCGGRNSFESLGAAYSFDGGATWQYTGEQCVDFKRGILSHKIPQNTKRVSYALAIPYNKKQLHTFVSAYAGRPDFKLLPLCRTKCGNENVYIKIGADARKPKYKLAFTARHHACEMTANYVLEGVVQKYFSNDPAGKWLRENVDIILVPFVDYDGVVNGDQGKNRLPHDHNRDYVDPIYPSVKAVKRLLSEWGEGKLKIAIDAHCPYIANPNKSDHNSRTFFTEPMSKKAIDNLAKFIKIFSEQCAKNPDDIQISAADTVKYNTMWNTLKKPLAFKFWAEKIPSVDFASSLEIPYTQVVGKWDANPDNARKFGGNLAVACVQYLQNLK